MTLLHIAEKCEGASGVATFVRELNVSLRGMGVDSRASNHIEKVGHIDVLHIHGLWLPYFHKAAKWAKLPPDG